MTRTKYHPPADGGIVMMERTDSRPLYMIRGHLHRRGMAGEAEVARKVRCPECDGRLALLKKKNTPLFDLECTGCKFKAQVKTVWERPRNWVTGAGWRPMEEWLNDPKHKVPPLIVNFKWDSGQQILFYPDIPAGHLKRRVLPENHRNAGHEMFNYMHLNHLRCITLFYRS